MRTIVTGAAGFIGSHLVRRLLDDGHDVVGVDNFSPYYSRELKELNLAAVANPRFEFLEADLGATDLVTIFDGVDAVFHLAGQPGVRASWGSTFHEYIDANVAATQRVLEAALAADSPRIVYASSSSIYGEAETFPTDEHTIPVPRSPYGVTKLAAEHLCRLYAANFALPTVSLRFFTVYGPRQRPDMAFTRFLRAARDGREITVYGSGEQVRDFTFVSDIVDALVRAGTRTIQPGSVFNVSGGGSHSINEVLDAISKVTGSELRVHREGIARGDVSRTSGDITSISERLRWEPRVGLEEGLLRQWEWVVATESR